MNIDGLGFQGLQGNNGVSGKHNRNTANETSETEGTGSTARNSSPQDSNIDKVQEFYLKFKAGVLSFEELCSRLEGLGTELQYQKDSEGNNIVGVIFQTKDGAVYCSIDGKNRSVNQTNSKEPISTAEENGLTVTTKRKPDGSSTITKKDKNGNIVEIEERNADNKIIKLTSYNEAGRTESVKEYTYNDDGSYIETVKNSSGRIVSKAEISADGKDRKDITPDLLKGSILNGQLFSMEDIIDAGFNSLDIAKHFTLVRGTDGNFYYEIKTNAGNAQSLEEFYNNVMLEKANEIIAKYESGSITFTDIIQELKTAGFTGISGKTNADGSSAIQYQCGDSTYTIENTVLRDINKDWAECVTGEKSVENFAETLKNYNGVSDIEYSKTDYGSEKITFKLDGILHSFVSIPNEQDIPEKEKEEEK